MTQINLRFVMIDWGIILKKRQLEKTFCRYSDII